MNGIQGTKPSVIQWNILLDTVVSILRYNNITIDHAIYIKVFIDGTVSYLTVSTDNVLNNTNNETKFTKLTIFFIEHFEMKVQEGSVLKYLKFLIFQSPIGFSFDYTDHIMELSNEWSPNGKFIKVDTPFITYSAYDNN